MKFHKRYSPGSNILCPYNSVSLLLCIRNRRN